MDVIEEFANGFCKAQNQSRMVVCEFRRTDQGTWILLDTDCAYGSCSHSSSCMLMKQVLEQKQAT